MRVKVKEPKVSSEDAKINKDVQKARKRLEKEIAREKKKITPLALKQMKSSIEYWLQRHITERISLSDKNISLFDANQHPEKVHSRHVQNLLLQLKRELDNPPSVEFRSRVKHSK